MPATMSPTPRTLRRSRGSGQKENCAPSATASGFSPPTETPSKAPEQGVWSASTPTKISPSPAASRSSVDGGCQMKCYEVKNTFIHYGSPLKTVSVVTPPKTVPSDFRPEMLFLEQQHPRLRTPAAVLHSAATPSTAGGALTGGRNYCNGSAAGAHSVYFAPPLPQVAAQPAPSSTLLRLSDFLPSPSASASLTGAPAVQQHGVQGLAQVSWQQQPHQQQPSTFLETMPSVPPLPGPPCQAAHQVLQAQMSPPPPPQYHAFDTMAGMQGMQMASNAYDPLQFITGEAPQSLALPSGYDHSRMQMPPQQPPSLPMDHSHGVYHLSSQCGMTPVGGTTAMSGPSPTSSVFCLGQAMSAQSPTNMGQTSMMMSASTPMGGMSSMAGTAPACGSVTVEGCLGAFCMGNPAAGTCGSGTLSGVSTGPAPSVSAISISASMFPEPGHMHQQQHLMPQAGTSLQFDAMGLEGMPMDMSWANCPI